MGNINALSCFFELMSYGHWIIIIYFFFIDGSYKLYYDLLHFLISFLKKHIISNFVFLYYETIY